MPNNTFIKLFHFLNADAADGNPGAAPGNNIEGADNTKEANGLRESGDNGNGPRGNKQDELQSIQYIDHNFVESSMETDNENFNREIGSPRGDVRIIYNPAKNKSKSLGRVGLTD